MKNAFRKVISLGVCTVLSMVAGNCGFAEKTSPHFLLTGETDSPVSFSITAPAYQQLSQFGTERLNSLNRLLSHISISVNSEGQEAEAIICIDDEPLISIGQNVPNHKEQEITTFESGIVYPAQSRESDNDPDITEINDFLQQRFFRFNNILDELYPVFIKTADSFPEITGESAAILNFSGFGKSVKRLTIQFSSDYVKDHFPSSLADLCETSAGKSFISSLIFQGTQKIVILYDKDDHIVRINYDGILGVSSQEISLVWKCLRSDDHIKDSLTIKTPAVTGYDKDNLSYDRDQNTTDPDNQLLKWDYQLDRKKGKEKAKLRYTGELNETNTEVFSKFSYSRKGDYPEHTVSLTASLLKEKEAEYTGSLEITNKTGKIITSRILAGLQIGLPADLHITPSERSYSQQNENKTGETVSQSVNADIVHILIRKMISLPEEDNEFLRKDIPDDIWETLTIN